MSRAAIPTTKKEFKKAWRQICVYSFPRKVLLKMKRIKKTPIENIEDIEILNFIEEDIKLKC